MKLTRLGDYAVRGVVNLAMKEGEGHITLEEIATEENIPRSFLAKIMKTLCRAGCVTAYRGKMGGYSLATSADEITLKDIIEAVEGPIFLNRCLVKKGECVRDSRCAIHPVWKETQAAIVGVLESHTASSLAKAQKKNLAA